LLKKAKREGMRIDDMFMNLSNAVLEESYGKQEPWHNVSWRQPFCFGKCGAGGGLEPAPVKPEPEEPKPEELKPEELAPVKPESCYCNCQEIIRKWGLGIEPLTLQEEAFRQTHCH
jgi:hypothetical protein